jgi:hypothetical protein
MKSPFYQRPEKRKFNYKPRFYEPDGGTKDAQGNLDLEKFGNRLHHSWSQKRQRNRKTKASLNMIIWLMFILIVLLFFAYKFIF